MLRPGHIKLPKDEAAETERAAGYARKQKWKELPGNRHTQEKTTGRQLGLSTTVGLRAVERESMVLS